MTSVPPTQPPAAPEGEQGPLAIACPACKKPAGEKCHTVIDGVDTGWLHDARYAAHSGFVMAPWSDDDPDAAPETDVSALREAIQTLHDLARGHDYADARELAAGEDAINEVFGLLKAARERVRVVEGERDKWRSRALSNAEQCDRNWAEACRATARAESAEAALAELRAGVEALHRPIRVYDECEHDADHGCEPIEVYDYQGCSESMIGWGCTVCCYDDEYPREDCPHGADHRGVSREQSCPTHALLGGAS